MYPAITCSNLFTAFAMPYVILLQGYTGSMWNLKVCPPWGLHNQKIGIQTTYYIVFNFCLNVTYNYLQRDSYNSNVIKHQCFSFKEIKLFLYMKYQKICYNTECVWVIVITQNNTVYRWVVVIPRSLFDQITVKIDVIPWNVLCFGYNTEPCDSHRL